MTRLCLFGDDEVIPNAHEIAWRDKNWDAVKELADEFKEKPESDLFAILNNINQTKADLSVEQFDSYSQYMINSMLSQHIECLPTVFNVNMMSGLPDQHHHNYLAMTIPAGRRFSKSLKLDQSLTERYVIALLGLYYQVNPSRAYDYKVMLEHKGKLDEFMRQAKSLATDAFLKGITKNPKEIKELKKL